MAASCKKNFEILHCYSIEQFNLEKDPGNGVASLRLNGASRRQAGSEMGGADTLEFRTQFNFEKVELL